MNSGYTVALTLTRLIASLTSVLCLTYSASVLVKQTIMNEQLAGITKLYVVSMLVLILMYLTVTLFLIRGKSTYDENLLAQKLLRRLCSLVFVVTLVISVVFFMLNSLSYDVLLALGISLIAWLISRLAHGLIVTMLQESIAERNSSSYQNFGYSILSEERIETLTQSFDYQDAMKNLPQSETHVNAIVKLRFALMPITVKADATLTDYSIPKRAK